MCFKQSIYKRILYFSLNNIKCRGLQKKQQIDRSDEKEVVMLKMMLNDALPTGFVEKKCRVIKK
jgi:hypothetical protein